MHRRPSRWIGLATLLVWQIGMGVASPGALASTDDPSEHGPPAHCPSHSTESLAANSAAPAGASHAVAAPLVAKSKPACCMTDACKCGAAPLGLNVGVATAVATHCHGGLPAAVLDSPPVTGRATNPFRPPI